MDMWEKMKIWHENSRSNMLKKIITPYISEAALIISVCFLGVLNTLEWPKN